MCRLMAYMGPPVLVADVVLWPDRSILKQSYDARERKMDASLPQHLVSKAAPAQLQFTGPLSNSKHVDSSMLVHTLCGVSGIWQPEWRWVWHRLVQPAPGVQAFRPLPMRLHICHSCLVHHPAHLVHLLYSTFSVAMPTGTQGCFQLMAP